MMLEKGLEKKDREVVVAPNLPTIDLLVEVEALIRALMSLQSKYEE